jgi:citrate synthase
MIKRQENLEHLIGLGHRIAEEDPRIAHMRRQSKALAARPGTDDRSHAIAERVAELVKTKPFFRERKLSPSVGLYSAPLLYQLGFPLDCFTASVACACIPGWIAHIHEQLTYNQVICPYEKYTGKGPRPFVPLENR